LPQCCWRQIKIQITGRYEVWRYCAILNKLSMKITVTLIGDNNHKIFSDKIIY
jgi:hypothetical protein